MSYFLYKMCIHQVPDRTLTVDSIVYGSEADNSSYHLFAIITSDLC